MVRPSVRTVLWCALGVLGALLAIAAFVFRDDILKYSINPNLPYQAYRAPPAPDYGRHRPWALLPADPVHPAAKDGAVDVFFVGPTTYDGPHDWNAPVPNDQADHLLERTMLPNYAGPFQRIGRVFAPRYRQAALYAFMALNDDARGARAFAYTDVEDAFRWYLAHANLGRKVIIVGVEQGATLASRLARQFAADPAIGSQLVAVYLIDEVVPREDFAPGSGLPACASRRQAHCVVAWAQEFEGDEDGARRRLERSLVWSAQGQLVQLQGRPALCVNPLYGAETDAPAPAKLNLGAANATGLEWGVRPAFLTHQVGARCVGGILRVSRPKSPSLRPSGSWADLRKAPAYNLFYRDLEADAEARTTTVLGHSPIQIPAPPITQTVYVRTIPKPHIGR